MARFVDLELDEPADGAVASGDGTAVANTVAAADPDAVRPADADSAPPVDAITRALGCYPVAAAVASHIDLNTLDALARASRGVHDSLIQYRAVLLASTLRCSNEASPVNREELLRYRARASNWHYVEHGRSFNGKSGDCAHDMVQACRRCGEVVCRNCAIKPPPPIALRERHRRLCVACARAPIALLTRPPLHANTPSSAEAVQRAVCKCDSECVWLCQPCGRGIRMADHEYQRVWRWRNHYGEMLGGLGTGIGDGDRGVVCGREEDCLAARGREQEVDCDAVDARDAGSAPWSPELATALSASSPPSSTSSATTAPSPPSPRSSAGAFSSSSAAAAAADDAPMETLLMDALLHEHEHEHAAASSSSPPLQLGPGYRRHEIEGIGGRVKRKLVRTVRVGACVLEWDDERGAGGGDGRILAPEVGGAARSWCGWCWRVIPGNKDVAGRDGEAESA